MSPALENIPVGLIANKVAVAAGMEGGIPGLRDATTLGEMAEHVKNLRMAAGMVASHIKKVKNQEASQAATSPGAGRGPQSSMGYSGGGGGGSSSSKSPSSPSPSPKSSSNKRSSSAQNQQEPQEEQSPLADPNYKSDALEEDKEENARAQGLRESQRNTSAGRGGYADQGDSADSADLSAVAQDQSIMSRQRDMYLSKLKSMRMRKAVDARKAQKAAVDKATKFLVQKVGVRFATAAFLASFVGFIIGYALVVFRCIAADIFMVQSQKFDDVAEQLAHWAIVFLGLVVLMIPVILLVIMIKEHFGWVITLIGWWDSITS